MKKLLTGLVILVIFLVGVFYLLKSLKPEHQQVSQPPAPTHTASEEAVVFDMEYRGLSGAKDDFRYNGFWGFGEREEETPFIKEVKAKGGEFSMAYNPYFKGAEWSAVEVKDNKAVAFYFDLNADGKVQDNEKILPIDNGESGSAGPPEFVTPDFMMTTQNGHKVPFRALLQVAFYGQPPRSNCMWSPSCVLEGTSTFNGKPTKLILFGNGFTGDFSTFGRSSYDLLNADEPSGQYISRHDLSSIIHYEGQFYNLKVSGHHDKDNKIQAELEPYDGTTGGLAIQLNRESNLKTKLNYARIIGSNDDTIRFVINPDQTKLPTGAYRLERGFFNYSDEKEDQWQVIFTNGSEFKVDADETKLVELGKPTLTISAVDENKRNSRDVQEQTVYTKGTNVYIVRVIKGKAGELYGRFSEKQDNSNRYTDIQPELKILDPDGKQIVEEKLRYG
jgi:hypothetical protein